MNKSLAILFTPTLLFALDTGGAINIESGYQRDSIRLEGLRLGIEREDKCTDIEGISLQLGGTFRLDNFFLRGYGSYLKTFSTPEYYTSLNGFESIATPLSKKDGWKLSSAFGYLFSLSNDAFFIGPEAGFAYKRFNIGNGSEIAASPFVGFQFLWQALCDWSIDFAFDFHFLGARRSHFISEMLLDISKTKKGHYLGPEVRLAADYSISQHWSLGVIYRFEYIFTNKVDLPATNYLATKQTWMTNNASLNVSYTF